MEETTATTAITVVGSDEAARLGWDPLVDPPGADPLGRFGVGGVLRGGRRRLDGVLAA
jgi:hypothetical protein